MSEANSVFPGREDGRGPQAERRFIQTSRRDRGGLARKQVVEVVHVHRSRAKHDDQHPVQQSAGVRAATWEDGFKVKAEPPAIFAEPAAPKVEVTEPVAHVIGLWQPSPAWNAPQPEQVESKAAEPPPAAAAKRGHPGKPRPEAPTRSFADPFAVDDRANCMRCGYLVETSREKRGLLTCAACG
jgi:hypothetical protein